MSMTLRCGTLFEEEKKTVCDTCFSFFSFYCGPNLKDCDKSLYFFTKPGTRKKGMFFARCPAMRQLMPASAKSFWDSVCEVVSPDIPRVSEFEIESEDLEWSLRMKEFEKRCSRRVSFDASFHDTEEPSIISSEKAKLWAAEFRKMDPRYQILSFFNEVAEGGAKEDSVEKDGDYYLNKRPLLWYLPNRASVFTVWRPTSLDSIRRMMLGQAVGKGLDIKGKSAKVRHVTTLKLDYSTPHGS